MSMRRLDTTLGAVQPLGEKLMEGESVGRHAECQCALLNVIDSRGRRSPCRGDLGAGRLEDEEDEGYERHSAARSNIAHVEGERA